MIGKIKKGSGFKGCVNYVLGKEQAALLHAEGVLTESRGDIIRSFCMQTGMNPDLKKPVGHIALSYSAVDAPIRAYNKCIGSAIPDTSLQVCHQPAYPKGKPKGEYSIPANP